MIDKYTATWVSHSSISDFLKCPRLYYLRNIYKNPLTRRKITIITPALALGQAVHEVVDELSNLPVEKRLTSPLVKILEGKWQQVEGDKGGFKTTKEESEYKERGVKMLKKIEDNPGPLLNKAIKIKTEDELPPRFWLSEENGILLNGKIDWLEFLPKTNSVHIIDFKTGKRKESEDSLQLPIYQLIATNTQTRPIERTSYWYLEFDNKPTSVNLPPLPESQEKVYTIAKKIKLARQLDHFKCPHEGCMHCAPYEEILKGQGKQVNTSSYQDIFTI